MSATGLVGAARGAREKALAVNLDERRYGTFAEIGAGQEVVRWFFRVGGAAGTIAKSISAYDMTVSDAIYGPCRRYVCRERLQSMLDHEQQLLRSRLAEPRGASTAFFTFADTVKAKSFRGGDDCHGWMGIAFQAEPGEPESEIVLHVRLRDSEAAQQQEALGIVGVNLVYGAAFLHHAIGWTLLVAAIFPLGQALQPRRGAWSAGFAMTWLVVAVMLFCDRDVAPIFGHLSTLADGGPR